MNLQESLLPLGSKTGLYFHVHGERTEIGMKIKAAVVYEKDAPYKIEEVDLAESKSNEILVRVVASGICHTDEAARTQQIPVPLPAVLGHEGCGIVEKIGADVKDIHPGDRVGFSYAYCGHCDNCRQGMPYACTEKLAEELGATDTVNRRECTDIAAEIKRISGGGVNYSVETSGAENFILSGLRCLRFKGVEAIVGIGGEVRVQMYDDLMAEEKTMTGVIEGEAVSKTFIPKLLDYYRKGLFLFDKLIKFYPFESINEVIQASRKDGCIKPVLRMG